MRTTVDLPDELLIAAKKLAAESRKTLREVFERSLRRELAQPPEGRRSRHRPIRWVTAKGGLPPGVDIRDRASTTLSDRLSGGVETDIAVNGPC